MKITKLFGAGLLLAALSLAPQSNASSGWDHGYYWSMWVPNGSESMTFPGAATYAGNWYSTWSNTKDGGGGKGWNPGADSRSVNYNCSKTSGFNNYGAYGWAPYPTYELYIMDRSSNAGGGTYK